jgi:hypothetical protein
MGVEANQRRARSEDDINKKTSQEAETATRQGQNTELARVSITNRMVSTTQKTHTLQAIISEVENPDDGEWLIAVKTAVDTRLGKVPRGGWNIIASNFNKIFKKDITGEKIKNVYNRRKGVKRINSGKTEIENKNGKTVDKKEEECGRDFIDMELLNKCKQVFDGLAKKYEGKKCCERDQTWKIPQRTVKQNIVETINFYVGQLVAKNKPNGIEEVSNLIYLAQATYTELTKKVAEKSKWESNIQEKIAQLEIQREVMIRLIYNVKNKKPCQKDDIIKKILRKYKAGKWDVKQMESAKLGIEEDQMIYRKKLEMAGKRKMFRQENNMFELYRGRFYNKLEEETRVENCVKDEEILNFWTKIWKRETIDIENIFETKKTNEDDFEVAAPHAVEKVLSIINMLPNWKSAGIDKVYNFFIKKITSLHYILSEIILGLIREPINIPVWMYEGVTIMIPKKNSGLPGDFRPITCLSNFYKIITKVINSELQEVIKAKGILSQNQLGTVRGAQGAKELGLVNKNINKQYENGLKATWIDIKKAYDSINHEYLIKTLESLNIPTYIINFINVAKDNWKTSLKYNGRNIGKVDLEKGILQGDSLSPTLFVLCIEPLSRLLNTEFPKLELPNENGGFIINHLIFIDDIKLVAKTKETIKSMTEKTKWFLNKVGFKINMEKSATNEETCTAYATKLEFNEGYKYLGVLENSKSVIMKETKENITREIYRRVERLCKSKLNAVNLFKGINEYAIAAMNYYIGLVEFTPEEFDCMDLKIREILNKYKIHYKPANGERLYMKRCDLGRGLTNINMMSERILLNMYDILNTVNETSMRKEAIIQAEKKNTSHLATIRNFIKNKYSITGEINRKTLNDYQILTLKNITESKVLHKRAMETSREKYINMKETTTWLTKGNLSPQVEGIYCYIQDRCVMFGKLAGKCRVCKEVVATVDHMATRCSKMLHNDYIRRHDEVVKSIQLHLCERYGFTRRRKIRAYKVYKEKENENAIIKTDMPIKTDIIVGHNKPDIFVYDKKRNKITLIEVGITSQENLEKVEIDKKRKYELLAGELKNIYKCKVEVIPIVQTWDGYITNWGAYNRTILGLDTKIRAYIQSNVLNKTAEVIFAEVGIIERRVDSKECRREGLDETVQAGCDLTQ